ncbi:sugar-binding transcriptional regulator [Hoeflea halophila]|nr:sugar-binding transcriptional regulator [Hoeflea halophila]
MESSRPHRPNQATMMLEAAWQYYNDGQNQNEIAKYLGLSRSTVVNYLAEAREKGLVKVSLNPAAFQEVTLARQLRELYGLVDAYVVPRPAGLSDADALRRVGRVAGEWLPGMLSDGDVLGVSWGETIYEVSLNVKEGFVGDVTVVQLVGSLATPLVFAAETCSSNIAQRLSAHYVNLPVPAYLSNVELARQLRAEHHVATQLDVIKRCNKTLFAAGTCTPDSHIVKVGVVTEMQLHKLLDKGAAAVICGQFIDKDGNPLETEVRQRMICVDLEDMRNKDAGFLVAVGEARVAPIKAVIKGGFATHLLTCARTAELLLQ